MSTKICPICGKEFITKYYNKKYCSKECRKKNRQFYKKEYDKYYIKHSVLNTCNTCHKKFISNRHQKYCSKECYKQSRKEYASKFNKQYNTLNKQKIKYYNALPDVRIIKNLRTRVCHALKRNSKSASTIEFLGCTIEELWLYLEQQFQPGMTRENYGEWHVDHIIPCCNFDLKNPEQQKICFHYSNLQPLWAEDNLKKNRY